MRLYPYKKEGLYGVMDCDANVVHQPNFTHVSFFEKGLGSACLVDGTCCLIHDAEIKDVASDVEYIYDVSSSRVLAQNEDYNSGYLDESGEWAIPCVYTDAVSFGFGLAPVFDGSEWKVLDPLGEVIGVFDYNQFSKFNHYGAVGCRDEKWFYVSSRMEEYSVGHADVVKEPKDGIMVVQKDGDIRFLSTDMNWFEIEGISDAVSFSEGLCGVSNGKEWWFVNIDGVKELDEAFSGLGCFISSAAPARSIRTKKWGMVNKSGKWLIEPIFDGIKQVDEKVAFGWTGNYVLDDGDVVYFRLDGSEMTPKLG